MKLLLVVAMFLVACSQSPAPAPANVSSDNRIELEKMGAVRFQSAGEIAADRARR